ncbi:hypothetical protein DPMN_008546 [Dreissena polymorpha]|uniref:AATF leucine zipper-containing domain-containing protein n=1 Tax=Dreissena polymorpha TaxID=45954 RepID=A0A9D4RZC4_DREPO|nr:hypothetical protein DPMN_008546 [Dreissena polymorpha]
MCAGLWDSLLEGRIKLQKAVSLINQLPQTDVWEGYVKSSTEFTTEASKSM